MMPRYMRGAKPLMSAPAAVAPTSSGGVAPQADYRTARLQNPSGWKPPQGERTKPLRMNAGMAAMQPEWNQGTQAGPKPQPNVPSGDWNGGLQGAYEEMQRRIAEDPSIMNRPGDGQMYAGGSPGFYDRTSPNYGGGMDGLDPRAIDADPQGFHEWQRRREEAMQDPRYQGNLERIDPGFQQVAGDLGRILERGISAAEGERFQQNTWDGTVFGMPVGRQQSTPDEARRQLEDMTRSGGVTAGPPAGAVPSPVGGYTVGGQNFQSDGTPVGPAPQPAAEPGLPQRIRSRMVRAAAERPLMGRGYRP